MLESTVAPYRRRLRESGVTRLGIFGSVARGEAGPDSDVDVLVTFAPEARTFDNLCAVGDMLEAAFRRPVDLVTADSLSPYLRPRILRDLKHVDLGS